ASTWHENQRTSIEFKLSCSGNATVTTGEKADTLLELTTGDPALMCPAVSVRTAKQFEMDKPDGMLVPRMFNCVLDEMLGGKTPDPPPLNWLALLNMS